MEATHVILKARHSGPYLESVPAAQEADAGGSLEPKSSALAWPT